MTKLSDKDIWYAEEAREKIEHIKDHILGNILKKLIEIKITIQEMKNILGRINGRVHNAEEKIIEHENYPK